MSHLLCVYRGKVVPLRHGHEYQIILYNQKHLY